MRSRNFYTVDPLWRDRGDVLSGYCFSRGVEKWIWILERQGQHEGDDDDDEEEEEDKNKIQYQVSATNGKVLCKYVNLHRFILAKGRKRGEEYRI